MKTFSTSAASSRTNMSASTMPCPPTPATIIAAAASTMAMAHAWVTTRRRSPMKRSSMSSANAPITTTSSGASGAMSASVRTGGVIAPGIIASRSSKLAVGEQARQLRDGGFHQVGQGLGPDAHEQHGRGEDPEHQGLAAVDVLHGGDVGVADLAVHHPLHQPQRIAGAEHQGDGRHEGDQRMAVEGGDDDHELAHEAR